MDNLNIVNDELRKTFPAFDVKQYGFSRISSFPSQLRQIQNQGQPWYSSNNFLFIPSIKSGQSFSLLFWKRFRPLLHPSASSQLGTKSRYCKGAHTSIPLLSSISPRNASARAGWDGPAVGPAICL